VTLPAKAAIRAKALAAGFDAVGFAAAEMVEEAQAHLTEFLAAGHHGDMGWLADTAARRASPRALWPEARSVVVLATNYAPAEDPLKLLARPDARRMVMVGAGAMAGPLIRAHCAVRPSLAEVKIWNRTAARAEELADLLSGEGIAATAAEDLEAAVREADLVCCATMSKTPVIQGDWLRPGTHLDLVGAFNPEMREADDAAIRRARVFVDSRATTLEDVGEIAIPLASGVLKEADILGDLFDLCGKSPPTGRQSAQDITFFKNGGGGHLDLMTARHVVACLERTGTTAESD